MDVPFINEARKIIHKTISEFYELAPGFLAVKLLSIGGCILYFDLRKWEPKNHHDLNNRILPKHLCGRSIGIYYEEQQFPITLNSREALRVAKKNFISRNREKWHGQPVKII